MPTHIDSGSDFLNKRAMSLINWQPSLTGSLIHLRPLQESDFEALHQAAADPLIWEQHPERNRYERDVFTRFFRSGMASKGALLITDAKSGAVIGTSRFTGHSQSNGGAVEIGFTFLTRSYWGGLYNRELKQLMLDYAFARVESVYFVIGQCNQRSQRAVQKLGAVRVEEMTTIPIARDLDLTTTVVYRLKREEWNA